jgi:hypothetical protein
MAKEKFVRLPDGRELTFPVSMSDAAIQEKILGELFKVTEYEEVPVPKKAPSFFQAFGEGATTLGNVPEALRYLYEPSGATRKEAAATTESPYEFQQVSDISGVGDVGRFVKEQAGQAVGFIAAPAAAAAAAGAVSGPFAPIVAPAAFLTVAGAQYLSNTAGRQAAEQEKRVKEGKAPEMPEVTKMLLTSTGQAGLDLAGFRLFKPLGQLIGLGGKDMVKQQANDILETAIEEGAEAAAKKLIGKQSVLKGAAYGAAIEAAQEPIQQLLERYGAGLELDSDEAIKEYFEAAVAGGLLGAPIGGVSTVMSNYQNDAYSKDSLKNLSDSIRGGKDPKTEWGKARKAIAAEAKPLPLLDEAGNVITITPEFLSTLGVNPSAKSIMGTPIENLIGKSATDPDTAKILQKFFESKLKETNEAIERKDITDEERTNLVALHSQLSTGKETFTTQVKKITAEKSNATKAANKAKAAEVTPEAKPTPDDALAVLESDIQKSFGDDAGRVFDLADELMSKGVVTDRAAALAQATKEVAQQKAADTQTAVEAETAVVPEPTETVKESADKIAEQEAAPEVAPEPGERSEAYMAVKAMKDKIDDLMRQSSEAQDEIMTLERVKYGSPRYKRKQELLEKRQMLDREAGDLLFKFDKAKDEYIKNNPEEVARIREEKAAEPTKPIGLTTAPIITAGARAQAIVAKNREEQAAAAPAPEVTPTPEPTPEVAEQMTYLRDELGYASMGDAIALRPVKEQAALIKQVIDTRAKIDQLEKNRTALRAQNDKSSADAVGEQIRKLENSIDDLEYSLTDVPNTREKVQEAIKANGNATEANKISTDIRKDMCD